MSSAASLLAELPPGVHGRIDTRVFARLGEPERRILGRVAEFTGTHMVAYDLRAAEEGLPLGGTVKAADLDPDGLVVLRAAEERLAPWIAVVAYA